MKEKQLFALSPESRKLLKLDRNYFTEGEVDALIKQAWEYGKREGILTKDLSLGEVNILFGAKLDAKVKAIEKMASSAYDKTHSQDRDG